MTDLRVERGKATRQRLVDAGRELFGERGYDATSVGAILLAAGVKKGALYHHFATKEELFDAVLDSVVAEIAAVAAEAARKHDDPVESLRAGCTAWLELALDPAIQRIALLDPPAVVGWSRLREIDERHALGGLRANMQRIAETGAVPSDQVDVLANMVLAAVNEAALMIARSERPNVALTRGRAAFDTLLDRLTGR